MKKVNLNNPKTKVILIVLTMAVILVGAGGTYALLTWTSSENTEITVKIGDLAGVTFIKGQDINVSNLGPVFDYEKDGESTEFIFKNYTENPITISAKLHVTTISDNLKRSDFKYALLSSTDGVSYSVAFEKSFEGVSNGAELDLVSGYTLYDEMHYKLIIYIDGNSENPISMQNGSLVGTITVNAV